MPPEAKVFIFEDSESFTKAIGLFLKIKGHQVVGSASTLGESLSSIDRFADLGVQVALVDGNLKEGDISGNDGRLLVEVIKNKAPHVKTVGMSMSQIEGVDIDVGKYNYAGLGDIITKL